MSSYIDDVVWVCYDMDVVIFINDICVIGVYVFFVEVFEVIFVEFFFIFL